MRNPTRSLIAPPLAPLIALLAATLLVACSRPADPDAAPPMPTGDAPAPTRPAPEDASPSATDAPGEPAEPTPTAPAGDPAPAPAPRDDPPVETMQSARVNAKIGVPVDLLYSFDAAPAPDRPVRLHLAAVPRVEAGEMHITVQRDPGLALSEGSLTVQKAAAAGVYRKQLSVTPQAGAPAEIRVLITMEVAGGSAHGFYFIPLRGGESRQKEDSVKHE